MHDDRVLIERRIERILRERLWPAVHGQDVPLAVEVWHAPGEPVAVAEALQAPYRPAQAGEAWGPAWGTSWFRLTGDRCRRRGPAAPVEAVIDLGFATDRPGFSAEALVHRPDGTAVKGLNPMNTWLRIAERAEGGEPVEFYVEAAANPLIEGAGTQLGDVHTADREPLYQRAPDRAGGVRRRGVGARAGRRGAHPAHARALRRRPQALEHPAHLRTRL